MNPAPLQPRPWPRSRWWLLIALVFATHVGLIFALGDRGPIFPRRPTGVPVLKLAADRSELLALNDPTLFALPHQQGFAGAAWLQIPPVPFRVFEWTEPPRWLSLPQQLGTRFASFLETNAFAGFHLELKPAPELTVPELAPERALATQSELRIEGGLAQRRLLNPIELTNQPSADLLTNSVVEVLVDAAGNVITHKPLQPGSGFDQHKADRSALDLAQGARFEPLPRAGAGGTSDPPADWSSGLMIFQWHTVPPPATNPPPAPTLP